MNDLVFDKEQFEANIWYYSGLEGIIKSDTWEQIIANCVNGKVIPGDHFMADVHNDKYCFNVKSIKEQSISKTGNKTVEFVQCRTPIANDRFLSNEDLGVQILQTLDNKLQESLEYFNFKPMIDVIILHNRYQDMYHASIYIIEHPDYSSYNLTWLNGEARLKNEDKWLIKRRWSDDNHRQTCTSIKKKYLNEQIVSNVLVKSIDNHTISKEEILNKYKEA
jgi:hypothetical protein